MASLVEWNSAHEKTIRHMSMVEVSIEYNRLFNRNVWPEGIFPDTESRVFRTGPRIGPRTGRRVRLR